MTTTHLTAIAETLTDVRTRVQAQLDRANVEARAVMLAGIQAQIRTQTPEPWGAVAALAALSVTVSRASDDFPELAWPAATERAILDAYLAGASLPWAIVQRATDCARVSTEPCKTAAWQVAYEAWRHANTYRHGTDYDRSQPAFRSAVEAILAGDHA